jgi:hypothetical protein
MAALFSNILHTLVPSYYSEFPAKMQAQKSVLEALSSIELADRTSVARETNV